MSSFISNYMSLAGQAVITALLASGIVFFLRGGRDAGKFLSVGGYGVLAAVLCAVVLALLGYTTSNIPIAVGAAVGVATSMMINPK